MSEPGERTNVAVACQGGGSHTAFTAGVLERLLLDVDWDEEYRLVGISGTSGGAFNAVAAWYGLVTEDAERSVEILHDLWSDLSADSPVDRMVNEATVEYHRLGSTGLPVLSVSPYHLPATGLAKREIEKALTRHVDFDEMPELCGTDAPMLVVGTVNVNAGEFETFVDEAVTPEALLASAAVPRMFEAVEINGHYHWDGLFSQNPPIRDLMKIEMDRRPDELWIVQINPQKREGEPTSLEVIDDRRNELSGNISLNQEVGFVEQVNRWIDEGKVSEDDFSRTEIRRVEIQEDLHCSTKVDRRPEFVSEMMERGRERGSEFLDDIGA